MNRVSISLSSGLVYPHAVTLWPLSPLHFHSNAQWRPRDCFVPTLGVIFEVPFVSASAEYLILSPFLVPSLLLAFDQLIQPENYLVSYSGWSFRDSFRHAANTSSSSSWPGELLIAYQRQFKCYLLLELFPDPHSSWVGISLQSHRTLLFFCIITFIIFVI